MLWEILLAVILVIGIFTALNEARLKRAAHKNKGKAAENKQYIAGETSKEKDK